MVAIVFGPQLLTTLKQRISRQWHKRVQHRIMHTWVTCTQITLPTCSGVPHQGFLYSHPTLWTLVLLCPVTRIQVTCLPSWPSLRIGRATSGSTHPLLFWLLSKAVDSMGCPTWDSMACKTVYIMAFQAILINSSPMVDSMSWQIRYSQACIMEYNTPWAPS